MITRKAHVVLLSVVVALVWAGVCRADGSANTTVAMPDGSRAVPTLECHGAPRPLDSSVGAGGNVQVCNVVYVAAPVVHVAPAGK